MAKVIMVQGTMSNAGKSLLAAGLCRIFKQDGYRVAPFKSQNMALNSFVTADGLEMGRAQVMQAEAAGCEPDAAMNPILLKPTDNEGSQVIVNGKPIGNMKAKDYFAFKVNLIPDILKAFDKLAKENDIIVIEGAGSPAEINLRENDIVNMGMAEMVDAPVLLVGDIDRGGVFAQLLGTMLLLQPKEQERVTGLVINKFRGDASLLDSGIEMLEEKAKVPVVGVVPYADVHLEDEDSLSERFDRTQKGLIDIAVIRFPRISNFTDLDIFEQFKDVSVRYVRTVEELGDADMIVLPGSKSTVSDLIWMKESGLAAVVCARAESGTPVFGICGGYQMLGETVADPEGVEGGGETAGLGLLPVHTVLLGTKTTRQYKGEFLHATGLFRGLSGKEIEGYEIHMGTTTASGYEATGSVCTDARKSASGENAASGSDHKDNRKPDICGKDTSFIESGKVSALTSSGTGYSAKNVYGTYVHGVFDREEIARIIVESLAARKGVAAGHAEVLDYRSYKETQYDKLADILKKHLDMDAIYGMLREARYVQPD